MNEVPSQQPPSQIQANETILGDDIALDAADYEIVNQAVTIALDRCIGTGASDYAIAIAVDMMKYCSYLHADMIPMLMFAPLFASEHELLKVVTLLADSKLIKMRLDLDGVCIVVHRVVQTVMRQKAREGGDEIMLVARLQGLVYAMMEDGSIMYHIMQVIKKNSIMLRHALALLGHCDVILSSYPVNDENIKAYNMSYAKLGLVVCVYYNAIADYEIALSYGETIEQLLQSYRDEEVQKLYALAIYWLAKTLFNQAKLDIAMKNFNESLNIMKQFSIGDNDEYRGIVANCIVGIANVYFSQGKYDLAREKYDECLNILEAVHGHNHPATPASLFGIADVYYSEGQYDLALEKYGECLTLYEAVYGRDHPEVADCLNKTANVFYSQGKYGQALEKFHEALIIREAIYGHYHPSVAASLNGIASTYDSQGRYDQAIEKYSEALTIRETIYCRDHPDVADSLCKIAGVYECQGKYDLALEKFDETSIIYEATYGHCHPVVASTLDNIAAVYTSHEKYDLALEKHNEALAIREAIYGHDHPDIANSLSNIGLVLSQLGRRDEAVEKCSEALRIYLMIFNNDESNPNVRRVRGVIEHNNNTSARPDSTGG
jgi:tetratricopeptide (TPR) repeat protein